MKKKPDPFMVDEDNPLWTEEDFARARPAIEVDPEFVAAMIALRKPGRPPATDPLVNLTIRVRESDLPKLRAMPGYQTKISQLVHEMVEQATNA